MRRVGGGQAIKRNFMMGNALVVGIIEKIGIELEKIIEKKELFSLKKGFGNITKNPTYLLEFDNK